MRIIKQLIILSCILLISCNNEKDQIIDQQAVKIESQNKRIDELTSTIQQYETKVNELESENQNKLNIISNIKSQLDEIARKVDWGSYDSKDDLVRELRGVDGETM